MWKKEKIDVRMKDSSDQYIHYEIINNVGLRQYWLTVVYAHNQLSNMREL